VSDSSTTASPLDALIAVLPVGIVRVSATGHLTAANAAAQAICRMDEASLVGLPVVGGLLSLACRLAYYEALQEVEDESRFRPGRTSVSLPRELLLQHGEGEPMAVELTVVRVGGSLGEVDLILRGGSDSRIRRHGPGGQGSVDGLTGLPTRAVLEGHLRVALARLKRHAGHVGVLFVDLDRMKAINDRFGHDAGDLFLCDVAARLRATVRDGDVVSRFGGDEFVVLVADSTSESEIDHVAERLRGVIVQPMLVAGFPLEVGASIGVALTSDPAVFPEDLLREADAAMYRSKILGGGLTVRFDEELRRSADERIQLESDLRQAIRSNEILTWFQPIVLLDGTILGAEALVRWDHPERGILPPSEFLPLAEETGLVHDIWRIVLEDACRAVHGWRQLNETSDLYVTVNVSPRQFIRHDLITDLTDTMRRCQIDATELRLEVTESVLVEDPVLAHRVLSEISALGIKVALDDFGTGYSSLSHLQQFPVDMVKIDRSFTMHLTDQAKDRSIVEALIILAEALGMTVCAEGIESREQAEVLRALQCPIAQGYLWGRPMSDRDFTVRIKR
jgi:diguanylate cyclase (GGDEF)-like protein